MQVYIRSSRWAQKYLRDERAIGRRDLVGTIDFILNSDHPVKSPEHDVWSVVVYSSWYPFHGCNYPVDRLAVKEDVDRIFIVPTLVKVA